MFDLKNCLDSTSAISLLASPVGPSPYGWLDMNTSRGSGLDRAPVSHSLPPVNEREPLMPDTSGPKCAASLNSAALQSSLESKLRARMEGRGAPEYALTWKHWDMPSGPPICALRASGRRISDRDCTGVAEGWSTPRANKWGFPDSHGSNETPVGWNTPRATDGSNGGPSQANGALSADAGKVTGWATPKAADGRGSPYTPTETRRSELRKQMPAGWPSPNAQEFGCRDVERTQERRKECKERTGNGNGFGLTLGQAVMLNVAGWPTPTSNNSTGSGTQGREGGENLQTAAGWAAPTTRDHKDTGTLENVPVNCLLGRQAPLSIAPTERRAGYALNPEFSRWLMGFPVAWGSCGAMAMQSCRSSRQSSSSPS